MRPLRPSPRGSGVLAQQWPHASVRAGDHSFYYLLSVVSVENNLSIQWRIVNMFLYKFVEDELNYLKVHLYVLLCNR